MLALKIAKSAAQTQATADTANGREVSRRARLRLAGQGSRNPAGHQLDDPRAQQIHTPGQTAAFGLSSDFSTIPAFPPDRPDGRLAWTQPCAPSVAATVQPKLMVGRADDPLERAADSTADRVMRMPDPAAASAGGPATLQRKCQACEEGKSEECAKGPGACEEERGNHPQELARARAHRAAEFDATEAPVDAQDVINRPGRALERAMRDFFEPRFGHDFSRVRVHADARAAASARALNARAYTVGANIVFGSGLYQPGTEPGRRLLAHELTHVRQQGMAPRSMGVGVVQRQPDAGATGPTRQPDAGAAGPTRQPDAGAAGTAPAPDSRVGTKAFNLILQQEFPVVNSFWFAGTQLSLPPGGGVQADLKTGRNGQVLFDLSPDFAPAGKSADETASDPARIAAVRAEVIRVLDWRLAQGILTAKDVTAPFVTEHLRMMAPLALRALRAKPKVEPDAQAELDRILAITTQLPAAATFNATGAAELTVNGVRVRILPDTSGGTKNETSYNLVPNQLQVPGFRQVGGRVKAILGPIPTAPVVEFFTNYATEGPSAAGDPLTATSGYGRGTTAADRAAGNTSLRFHESRHGQDILDFIASHPFPVFTGAVNMTVTAYKRASATFLARFQSWSTEIGRVTLCKTDCVGSPDIDTFEHNTGAQMKCTTCHP
jgi:hypothetical protein